MINVPTRTARYATVRRTVPLLVWAFGREFETTSKRIESVPRKAAQSSGGAGHDVRVIAATNRDREHQVKRGPFRQDLCESGKLEPSLYFRMKKLGIKRPPGPPTTSDPGPVRTQHARHPETVAPSLPPSP